VTDQTLRQPAAPADPDPRRVPHVAYPISLAGQPALVTGANSGIGKAVALGLAAAGADVVINYVTDPAAAEEVAHAIEAMGRRALTIKADVSREDEITAMFAKAVDHFGTLHIVVSNAGLQRDAPFDQMTLEQWNTVIGVNLTGQFLCAREAARIFKGRGVVEDVSLAAGKIVCMSSVHQEIPWAGHANYASSKGGVMALVLGMTKYTPEATKSLLAEGPTARAAYVTKTMEAMGGKVLGYYFAEGADFDVVALIDARLREGWKAFELRPSAAATDGESKWRGSSATASIATVAAGLVAGSGAAYNVA